MYEPELGRTEFFHARTRKKNYFSNWSSNKTAKISNSINFQNLYKMWINDAIFYTYIYLSSNIYFLIELIRDIKTGYHNDRNGVSKNGNKKNRI